MPSSASLLFLNEAHRRNETHVSSSETVPSFPTRVTVALKSLHFELVGLAVGQVPHALFEAGFGDRFLEVVQG
jgi:hypothetical protein